MRYVVSCQRCHFMADANDIRGVGSQLNIHASNCADDPVLVIEGGEPEYSEAELPVTDLMLLVSK
jgi:hypothetical protein